MRARVRVRIARLSMRGLCRSASVRANAARFDTSRRGPRAFDRWTRSSRSRRRRTSRHGAAGGRPAAPGIRGRIPWLALVFVALAIADLYWMLRQADFLAGMSAGDIIGYSLRVTPGIAAILMPAAVLLSHRDSWRRIPTVVFGTILFASVQGSNTVTERKAPT